MADVIVSGLDGLMYNTASPATSGMEVILDAITGTPHCIDSSTGIPNPS